MKRLLLLIPALLLAGCGELPPPPGHQLTGTLLLIDPSTAENSCTGEGGFSDISVGGQVTVSDGSQKTLAITDLKPAEAKPTGYLSASEVSKLSCSYTFSVLVPDAPFYDINIGHRDLKYSMSELQGKGWKAEMTLGGN